MDTLQNLKAFLAVARSGSFSAAGRQLGIATSVVAKRIDQLEWAIRTKLFARSTRRIVLTETGERWLQRVQSAVAELDEVLTGMARAGVDLEGHLRIKMPTTLTILYLGAIVSQFQFKHPRVSLEIVLADRPLNPVEEGFDIAVTVFPDTFGGIVDEPLCPLRRLICASPDYLAVRGIPHHPRDLLAHDILNFLPTGPIWSFQSAEGPVSVEIRPKLSTNDNHVLFAAACDGNGIALLASYVAGPALRDGSLVQVLGTFPITDIWIKALIPENRALIPRIRTLVAFLKDGLSPVPPWELV